MYKKNNNTYIFNSLELDHKKNNIHLKKPKWIKIKYPVNLTKIQFIKNILRKNKLHSVCEEAACPNLPECFNNGTATFMLLGSICTRKCPFCAVNKGRPKMVDSKEPKKIANLIKKLKLKHVVLTSVNRDDLIDGGATHFSRCINKIRKISKSVIIEILVPDFRNFQDDAIKIFLNSPPNIFNHNIENVPRLYSVVKPGSNYLHSLNLLKLFHIKNPNIPTKSGLMLGLGENIKEILLVLKDLRTVGVSMLTIGQYMQPSKDHLSVKKYVPLHEFKLLEEVAKNLGFKSVFCGPLVRSSYHAEKQKNFL